MPSEAPATAAPLPAPADARQPEACGDEEADLPDELAARAGAAIRAADFLLIAGGAGMSADSGLATFGTITQKLGSALGGLTYDQAAGSNMMFQDPELFYGFWFTTMRSYSEAEPHEGYSILREWAAMAESRAKQPASDSKAAGLASPTFVLTTNVDGFFRRSRVAPPESIGEIHGSLARWQCGGVPSGKKFPLLQRKRCGDALFEAPSAEAVDYEAVRYRSSPPRCPKCGDGWLRPHVFLFGDGDRFVDDRRALGLDGFAEWRGAVLAALRADDRLRLVVVEVGCGLRVPNLRKRCEELFTESPAGQCEFVRINPEYEDHGLVASPSLAVRATGLAALRRLHREVVRAEAAGARGSAEAAGVPDPSLAA